MENLSGALYMELVAAVLKGVTPTNPRSSCRSPRRTITDN